MTNTSRQDSLKSYDTLFHSNWHIHSCFSPCASREMTVQNIVKYAEIACLKQIAIVDHHPIYNQNILDNIDRHQHELAELQSPLKVILGAELSAYGVGKYADSPEENRQIPYRLYSCNHYHQDFWEHPKILSARGYAEHELSILRELIPSGRSDCIAHPFIGFYIPQFIYDYKEVTRAIHDDELMEIFTLGKKHNVAWEINTNMIYYDFEFAYRYWNIGNEIGVTFRVGTDAHQLNNIVNDALECLLNTT